MNSIIAGATPYLLSITRIIFGFLLLRHGTEQAFGFPEASDVPTMSVLGLINLLALPGGLLMMLGLFTRPTGIVLSIALAIFYLAGPLQEGFWTLRNGGDPAVLSCLFFLYLAAAGAGAWSLDQLIAARSASATARSLNKRKRIEPATWTPYVLSVMQIIAGLVFVQHGWQKLFGFQGGRIERDIMTIRGFGGFLETIGGPLISLGLFMRPTAFILSGEMAVAYFRSWAPRGFWASFSEPGMEASILFCFLFLFFFAAGTGAWSLDALIKRARARKAAAARPQKLQESVSPR
jgi:putative oxidoreductase